MKELECSDCEDAGYGFVYLCDACQAARDLGDLERLKEEHESEGVQ